MLCGIALDVSAQHRFLGAQFLQKGCFRWAIAQRLPKHQAAAIAGIEAQDLFIDPIVRQHGEVAW
jgi:hypothetical protein